jgi:aspartyl/asparaginyl beta-hydroxylase (cupin superfamily)
MDALLVVCTRSSYEGRQDPGWQLMDGKMMATLDDLYRRYMITTNMRRLVLNVDDEDTDRQVNDIIQKLDNPWER